MRIIKGKTYYNKPWYNSYRCMMSRCYREKDASYKFYGGRGIRVCEEWHDSTISKMEQVETMSCQECKHFHENAVMYLDQCDYCFKDCKYEPKDEPQTERSE